MSLKKYKLGELIDLFTEKCGISNLSIWEVSGINSDKEFFEPARQVGSDTSDYKNVPSGYFACNLMHVGRDKVLPIALNFTDKNKIVSPAYTVFKISANSQMLKEYFFILLKSSERDRYFGFHADSSVRDGMSLEDFCDIDIFLPPLEIQKKYVAIYKAMLENQKAYERGLDDLKLVCDGFIDRLKNTAPKKFLEEIFREIDNRNEDGKITNIQGINITKQFMNTVADMNGVNLNRYKIVRKGQFAFSGMQTGRDECIRIALYEGEAPIIISPAYTVFEPYNENILPEYVMMWFQRKESDRRGWFMSDSSVRTNLDNERFYEIQIPIPEIKIQKSIANIYKVYTERKRISERLKAQIKNICPVLIKGAMEEGKQ